ncbi:protein of unassigned function [Methylobacterium oryzae CBMB20]|uniref:Protein of unassigned function n=1 Tax=Methylobacterium oryzae CBMB20 TaxID=693986 RepID=A0A089NTH7_9HYPH|nr:protein of unassigned function [Methylobacterium oryzae CBMB20]
MREGGVTRGFGKGKSRASEDARPESDRRYGLYIAQVSRISSGTG